jgi:hypothetical protein
MAIVDGMTDDERRNVIRHALIAVLHYRREKRVGILEEWAMSLWATIRIRGSASYKRAAVADDPPDPRRPPVPVADVLAMLQDGGGAEPDEPIVMSPIVMSPGAVMDRFSNPDYLRNLAEDAKRAGQVEVDNPLRREVRPRRGTAERDGAARNGGES